MPVQLLTIAIFIILALLIIVATILWPARLFFNWVTRRGPLAEKALWTTLMVLFWPFGPLLYGIRDPAPKVRRLSALSLIVALLLLGSLLYTVPYFLRRSQFVFGNVLENLSGERFSALSPEERSEFEGQLKLLKSELEGNWLEDTSKKQQVVALAERLQSYLGDGHMDSKEYADWKKTFEMRNLLSPHALGGEAQEQKRDPDKAPDRPVPM